MKLRSVATKLEDGIEETLTYMDFLTQHWSRLRHVAGTQWGTRRYMNMDHLTIPEDGSCLIS